MESTIPQTLNPITGCTYKKVIHKGKGVILIVFEYSPELTKQVRTIRGARWSPELKSWYTSDLLANRLHLGLEPEPVGKEVLSYIDPINQPALYTLIDTLKLKAYSASTIQTYRNEFAQLLYALEIEASRYDGRNQIKKLYLVLSYDIRTIRKHHSQPT